MIARSPDLSRHSRWSSQRSARLGFLVGLGLEARDVARDPDIASTVNNVRRQVRRLGLAFRDVDAMRLPHAVIARIDAAANERRVSRSDLIQRLILNAGSDDGLIDNILDDLS